MQFYTFWKVAASASQQFRCIPSLIVCVMGFLILPGRNRMKSNSLLQCCKLAGWLSRKDNNFRSETFGRGTGPGQHQNRLKIQDLAKEWENFTSSEKDVVESIENCRTKQPKSSQQALFAASCREAHVHARTHTHTHRHARKSLIQTMCLASAHFCHNFCDAELGFWHQLLGKSPEVFQVQRLAEQHIQMIFLGVECGYYKTQGKACERNASCS